MSTPWSWIRVVVNTRHGPWGQQTRNVAQALQYLYSSMKTIHCRFTEIAVLPLRQPVDFGLHSAPAAGPVRSGAGFGLGRPTGWGRLSGAMFREPDKCESQIIQRERRVRVKQEVFGKLKKLKSFLGVGGEIRKNLPMGDCYSVSSMLTIFDLVWQSNNRLLSAK